MPYLQRDGYRLHYRQDGPSGAPVLLLSHSLGANLEMWQPQMETLARQFHILRYDHPGHGKSDPRPDKTTIANLGADALALMDALHIDRANFCGLSLGGMVGMWLAANAPQRLSRMITSSAAARIESPALLRGRIDAIASGGLEAIANSVMEGWFTPDFRARQPQCIASIKAMFMSTNASAYAATAEAVCAADLRPELDRIHLPVLVVYGAHDRATPPQWNRDVARRIAGAKELCVAAAHLANVEAADAYTSAVLDFLKE